MQTFEETGELKAPAQYEWLQRLLKPFPGTNAQVPGRHNLDISSSCSCKFWTHSDFVSSHKPVYWTLTDFFGSIGQSVP